MKTHSFSNSKNIGKLGEAVLHNLLKKAKVGNIIDVTEDRAYQSKGIDFIVEETNTSLDAKLDIQAVNTGNIAIETISKFQNGKTIKPGWVYTSEVNLVSYMYMDTKTHEWCLIFFTLKQAEQLIKDYEHKPNAKKRLRNYDYESEIVKVPIHEIGFLPTIKIPVVGNPSQKEIKKLKELLN